MMNIFLRWVKGMLDQLLCEPTSVSGEAASAAADSQSQPTSDAAPVSEEAAHKSDLPPADAPAEPDQGPAENSPLVGSADKHAACRAVFLSDRAYSAIFADVARFHPYETGGVFLGHMQDGVWYVVEATDPGPHADHALYTHKMDDVYMDFRYHHLRRMYRQSLHPLGFWHRHPGSFDRFSDTDMKSNVVHARLVGNGAISMLVNIDPDFRLTCYYCPLQPDGTVKPVQVPVLVGDHHFAGTDFLTYIYPDERIRPVTDCRPAPTDKTA